MATKSEVEGSRISYSGQKAMRSVTLYLPAETLDKAEALAKREGRTLSEVFGAAFRSYHVSLVNRWFEELEAYDATRNPNGYTEDIPG